jgi:hypothetical protein
MQLIEDLKSEDLQTRTKAAAELERFDRSIVPYLREYVGETTPNLELARRLEEVAAKVERRYALTTAQQTMLDALNAIAPGSKEARKLLRTIAEGWAESDVTQRARAILGD